MDVTNAPDRLQPGDHACQLVDGPAGRRAAVARQAAAATAAGERLVVLTDRSATPDLAALAGLAARAVQDGRTGLRLVADLGTPATHLDEPAGDAGVAGVARFVAWEDRLSRLALDSPVTAVCLYDRGTLDRDTLWRLVPGHAVTLTAAGDWSARLGIRRLPGGGLRLTGEADLTNREALRSALDALHDSPPTTGAAVIDVTALTFADASAAQLLLRATGTAPGGLRVTGANPLVARVLSLLSAGRAAAT